MLWVAGRFSALSAWAELLGCGVFRGSQAVIPVAVSLGPDASDVGVGLDEPPGGVIAGVICVVSACDVVQVEGVDPCWQRGGEACGGEEEVDPEHGGHLDCGEGVDGALDEQGGSGLGVSCDPEAATGFPGSWGHAAEGWSGAGAAEFGADGCVAGISGEEDGIDAVVGAEDVLLEASVEDCGIEAALAGEVLPDGGPGAGIEAFAERVSGAGWRLEIGQDLEGLEEGAVLNEQDEVDGPSAAGCGEMVVELAAVDAEDGAGAFPARAVAVAAAVSECGCDALQGDVPERVGAQLVARGHGPTSRLAIST